MVAVLSIVGSEFRPGDIVEGRYKIVRKLADGGMSTVYLAEHVLIRRRVALKLLHADLAADSSMVRRFMNEASAAGTLGHPHIVESTDMGFTRRGIPYIVFEYLEGCLLVEEVNRLGGLPVRRAVQIASQIASALDAAHNARIVHLDLKTDNVFLIDRGDSADHAKVLDFGISRFMEADLEKSQRGLLAGTPEFMAPEQVTMPDLVDGRADIYALGVVLYEMLTTRCPHANPDPRVVMHRVVHDPPPPLDRVVPERLERLLFDKLLAKSRDQRLETMREVKSALDDIATMLRPSTSESPWPRDEPSKEIEIGFYDGPVSEPLPPPVPMLRPRAWWPVAALIAGLAGGALWVAEQQQVSSRERAARARLEADAGTFAAMLAIEARIARDRASDLAGTPTARATIETHPATRDAFADGQRFHLRAGEVIELVTAGTRERLRYPPTAPPLITAEGAASRLVVQDGQLLVVASAPVVTQGGEPGGTLAIAAPVDLALIKRLMGEHALIASLLGLDQPLLIARRPGAIGVPLVVPVAVDHGLGAGELSLAATIELATGDEISRALRYASWTVGALLLAGYLLGWIAFGTRARGQRSYARVA